MTWRVAICLDTLRKQINAAFPHRQKENDGTIGDERHQSRTSDHNPWVDGHVVTAMDITHDPATGIDCHRYADALVKSGDRRIKYIIWNGRIANAQALKGHAPFEWAPYHGSNAHEHHLHLSVVANQKFYDDPTPWNIEGALNAPAIAAAKAITQIAAAAAPPTAPNK